MNNIFGKEVKKIPFHEMALLIKQNDAATLKALYLTNFPKVRRYVLKNNGDEQQAKDVYQEAFVAMWRNIKNDRFLDQRQTMINGYLFRIAKHKWLDYLRSAKYKNTIFINHDLEFNEQEEDIEDNNDQGIKSIMDCFEKLDERCQMLLKLFYFERRPFAEIAKILAMDEASAKNAKYRCQEQLNNMIQIIPNGTQ